MTDRRENSYNCWIDILIGLHISISSCVPTPLPERWQLTLEQVLADGYKPITTQIFDKSSKYLDDDSVFAVKDSLVVEFLPREGDERANNQLNYNIHMAPLTSQGESGEALVTTGMGRGY
jgi:catechol 1,2-dioxygenase